MSGNFDIGLYRGQQLAYNSIRVRFRKEFARTYRGRHKFDDQQEQEFYDWLMSQIDHYNNQELNATIEAKNNG